MQTGFRGTFVLSWSQIVMDGLEMAPFDALAAGVSLIARGEAAEIIPPHPEPIRDPGTHRQFAIARARRLLDQVQPGTPVGQRETGLVLTDGAASFTAIVLDSAPDTPPFVVFPDGIPPSGRRFWVAHVSPAETPRNAGGVICFTPGTSISTPSGPRRIESLREGDHVLTRDDGPQPILWIGHRRISGARLAVAPHLRPVLIGAGALGIERPEHAFLVSPLHRMLVKGPAARALFGTPEVLVAARDLIDDKTIRVPEAIRGVTYIHLLLERHQVLWANNVESESFHPGDADLDMLDSRDRTRLDQALSRPGDFGALTRRALTRPEAELLRIEAA